MHDFEQLDHYELLGVQRSASPEEIKRAYRQAISLYHPDRYVGMSAAEQQYASARAGRITEAYRALSDRAGRAQYNAGQQPTVRHRPPAAPPPGPRDHLAELYSQAQEHIAARRYVQAAAVLRQLQQLSPLYRDSADLLAEAERRASTPPPPQGGAGRTRAPLLVAGVAGLLALGGLGFWVSRARTGAAEVPTAAPAVVAAAPTLAPTVVPTTVPALPSAVPPSPNPAPAVPLPALSTAAPTVAFTPEPTSAPTAEPTLTFTVEPTAEPTAEPTVEPAADTSVESGPLLASTAFDGTSGWPFTSGVGWSVGEEGGAYIISAAAGIGDIWSYRTLPAAEPLSIGVDAEATGGEAGLLFRFNQADNSYLAFVVDQAAGTWAVRSTNGTILATGQANTLNSSGTNRLVVALDGATARLAINGEQAGEANIAAQPFGSGYGLLSRGTASDAVATFRRIEIRALP